MIYTIVADIFDFNEIYSKRDCHDMWQPLSLIPEDVLEYIESSRSEKTRLERFCAYFTLFLTVERFYKKKNLSISRTEHGKPYLVENGEKSNIHISISHTDGAIAVAISDEYELGVDLQINISEAQEKRLEKRFFDGVKIKNEIIDQEIYRLTISNNIDFEKICETNMSVSDFTQKWAFCESVLKCDGKGFLKLSQINELEEKVLTSVKNIRIQKDIYALATSIKSAIM